MNERKVLRFFLAQVYINVYTLQKMQAFPPNILMRKSSGHGQFPQICLSLYLLSTTSNCFTDIYTLAE